MVETWKKVCQKNFLLFLFPYKWNLWDYINQEKIESRGRDVMEIAIKPILWLEVS